MSPFHSGMNHWQRQWLSDRLHKKQRPTDQAKNSPVQLPPQAPAKLKPFKSSLTPKSKTLSPRPAKIIWPAREVLEKLLWEKATCQIANDLGVSDKAVEKHCRKLALKKPPRGYWAKKQAEKSKPANLL
jgi:hypothetical protein